jgi:predicted membrane protein
MGSFASHVLSSCFSINKFTDAVKKQKTILAAFLLKQNIFSGIGNYIKNEALHLTNLKIKVKTNDLSNQQIINNINNKEHFNSCSYAEHLNNCEACRNAIIEKFSSKSSACVNLFGMGFNISKDALQVIFIILIVAIFILLLSLVNIPMKDNLNVEFEKAFKLKLKYLMMNQMNYPNIY